MGRGRDEPYHIKSVVTTVATYLLIQWVGVIALVTAMVVVVGGWADAVYGAVPIAIGGTVWAAVIMLAQAAFASAPGRLGGTREIGKVQAAISIAAGAICATWLCSLVMWLLIAMLLAASDGTASGPLSFLGCGATVCLFIFWIVTVRTFIQTGRREERYAELALRLLKGTGLCAIVCLMIAFLASIATAEAFVWIATVCTPWLGGAAIALLGCRLYLKRLWIVRAPWYETHCAECGYDLSGNLDASTCSECGTPWKHTAIVPAGSKRAAGKCDNCGYDMRGTPNADKCPECGTGWRVTPSDVSKSRGTT